MNLEDVIETLVSKGYKIHLSYQGPHRRAVLIAPKSGRYIGTGSGPTWQTAILYAVREADAAGWPLPVSRLFPRMRKGK